MQTHVCKKNNKLREDSCAGGSIFTSESSPPIKIFNGLEINLNKSAIGVCEAVCAELVVQLVVSLGLIFYGTIFF